MGVLGNKLKNYQAFGNPNPVEVNNVNLENGVAPSPSAEKGEPEKTWKSSTGFGPLGESIIRGGGVNTDFTPESYAGEAAEAGWGTSRYDRMTGYVPGANIEDVRANAQPWYWKIGNGVAKGGVTAATTAVNTVAGTVFGVGSSLFELGSELANDGEVDFRKVLDAGVNNFLSEQMIKFQNYSEELFPNYRTEEEQSEKYQREWWKHMGTANFIGDSFLKNFGFTVGAMAGGAVWTKFIGNMMAKGLASNILKGAIVGAEGDAEATAALKNIADAVKNGTVSTIDATKLVGNLESVVKKINRMDARLQLYGAAIGAMGEGTTEGLMAKDEFLREYMPMLEQQYQAKMDKAEADVLSSNPFLRYYVETGEVDENGNPVKVLTQRGIDEVNRRKNDLTREYMRAQAFATEQGDKLAATTFMLNLPLLTASNTIQFGRMFSRGWKTARRQAAIEGGTAIAEAAGKEAALALNAGYKATGSVAGRTILNSLKVAGSEAFEEMAQGTFSSGTKNVAAHRLAAFNNDAYDPEAVGDFGNWFEQMVEGGKEYLGDVKNWQEGFLGAVTGLLGIPSRSIRTWNGGVIGAYNEAKANRTADDTAAEILNTRVNSKEFQDRWQGYIRHMGYDKKMKKAAVKNDQYAWHNENDKQLISDIIAFDNAGKLDDLIQIVDSYASITEADAKNLKPALGNENGKLTEAEIVTEVKKRAEDFKEAINQYKAIYDALSARTKPGTSSKFFEEIVFTANQIKLLENRFLKMFDETVGVINKAFGSNEADTEELMKIYNSLSKYFTGNIVPGNLTKEEQDRVDLALDVIKKYSKDKKEVASKIDDMKKLSADRAAFYNKLVTLEGATQEEFNEEAITPEKVKKTALSKQIRNEAELYGSVEDVKVAYRSLPKDHSLDREFLDTLLEMQDSNPNVKAFLELNEAYQDFKESYDDSKYKIPSEQVIAYNAQKMILDDLYDSVNSRKELLDFDMDQYLSKDATKPTKKEQDLLTQLRATGPGGLSDRGYAKAVEAIRNGLAEYNEKLAFVGNRPAEKTKPTSLAQTVKGAPKPPGLREQVGMKTKQGGNQSGEVVKDKLGRDWKTGQKVYMYKVDDEGDLIPVLTGEYTIEGFFKKSTKNDAVQARLVTPGGSRLLVDLTLDNILRMQPQKLDDVAPVETTESFVIVTPDKDVVASEAVLAVPVKEFDENAEKEVDTKAELSGSGNLHYLRTGMPEHDSFAAKVARDIVYSSLDPAEKKRKLAEVDLSDFSEINEDYKETYQALQNFDGQNAFENVATILTAGDKIEFRIDDRFPAFKFGGTDEAQVLLYTKKNGKDYLLTTLVRKTSLYSGLQGLREAIFEQYNKWKSEGGTGVFTFKDSSGNPITTTVFAKRNGMVVYNQNDRTNQYKNERDIKEISGYDPEAPIVYIDRNGTPRGLNTDEFDPNSLSNVLDNIGALYYLAKGNNGKYVVPIRLGVEHLNKDTKQYTSPTFNAIKSAFNSIANYVKSVSDRDVHSDEDRRDVRNGLGESLKALADVLDIHNDIFTFYADKKTGKTTLRIYSNDIEKSVRIAADKITPEWLLGVFAARNRSINIGADTGIKSLVEQGLITSNAVAMRPRGVDFYTYPWNEEAEKFEPYQKQETIAEQSAPKEDKSPGSTVPTKEELGKEMKERKEKIASVPTEKPAKKAAMSEEGSTPRASSPAMRAINWADLSDDEKEQLQTSKGYTEKTWKLLTKKQKQNELDCLGISF